MIPIGITLVQPDLGSAIIMFFVWIGMLIAIGLNRPQLFVLAVLLLIVGSVGWVFVLKPYQKNRIITFLDPAHDPLGSSYNLNQAKIAIGSGGWWGKGLGHGSQSQLNFLPEKHTDFIFAVLAEEWGFFGVAFICALFLFILWRVINICLTASNNFFRLIAAGYALLILIQVFINVGMNLGIMPITGISLPFLSYGGSGLLFNFLALGLLQNIIVQGKKELGAV